MGLVRPTLAAAVATALVAAALTAAPATAQTDRERGLGGDGGHFPASVTTNVPPGGYSTITSPTIPKGAKTLQVDLVAKANATEAEVEAFDKLAEVFGKITKGKRLLTCILLYNAVVTQSQAEDDYDAEVQFQANEASLALAALVGCIRLAGLLTSTQARSAAAPSLAPPGSQPSLRRGMRKCVQDKPGVPGTVDHADEVWTLTVDGTLKKTRNKLRIGCRTKSGKTVLKIRAAKKGVPLRRVMGKRPQLSLVSPADAGAKAPTKVTFSLP